MPSGMGPSGFHSLETIELAESSGQLLSAGLARGGCAVGVELQGTVGVWGLIALLFLIFSQMIFRGVWRFFCLFLFHFMPKLQAPDIRIFIHESTN